MKKTLELRPWHERANLALAKYYEDNGNKELAAQYRRQALGLTLQGNHSAVPPFGLHR
jgi:Tfp pilus assembly protein PilF